MSPYQSHLDHEKQSWWPKKLENFLLCYVGKWAGGHSFAYQYGCWNINAQIFSKL